MKQRIIKSEKITNNSWINLFKVQYINSKDKVCNWIFASRKKQPFKDKNPDAVVLIPIINTSEGRKLVVTKEYRVTIEDYEYGFPAGLIDEGMTVEETVEKELKEETGLEIKKITNHKYGGKYLYPKIFADRPDIIGQTYELYSVEVCKGKIKIDKKEHSSSKWVTYKEAMGKLTQDNQKQSLKIVNCWLKEKINKK